MRLPDRRVRAATAVLAAFGLVLGVTGCSLDEDQTSRSVAGWTHLHPGGSDIEAVVTVSGNPSVVYTTTDSGRPTIFESTDGGGSWTRIAGESGTWFALLAVDPRHRKTLFAQRWFQTAGGSISPTGLVKSTDDGRSWTSVNRGLPKDPPEAPSVSALAFAPSGETLYAASGNGIFRSINAGASWARVYHAPRQVRATAIAVDPKTPSTLYAGTGPVAQDGVPGIGPVTVLRSTDSGKTWWRTTFHGDSDEIDGIAIDPHNPRTLYVTASNGFYKSEDHGKRWTRLGLPAGAESSALFPSAAACSTCPLLAIDPSRPDTVYVSAYDVMTDESFVLKSTTGGRTWNVVADIKGQYGESFPLSSLAIDPTGHRVYGGMEFGDLFVCETCWQKTSPRTPRS